MFFEKKKEVEDYIKNVIEKSLFSKIRKNRMVNCNINNVNLDYYIDKICEDKKTKNIFHLIMGKE